MRRQHILFRTELCGLASQRDVCVWVVRAGERVEKLSYDSICQYFTVRTHTLLTHIEQAPSHFLSNLHCPHALTHVYK